MDYEKEYKKLKAAIKNAHLYAQTNSTKAVLENILPELTESEDERVRKALINGFNVLNKSAVWYNGITNGQILAWLEKQKTSEEAIQYLKENHSPSEVSDFQTAMNIAVAKAYDKGMKDGLEKQGKSLDQIHYWTEEEIEPIISDYLRGAEHYGGMIARLRCLKPKSLEKQGRQKFADKVETNFKVGDWVVYYKFGVKDIDKIAKLDNDKVIFESGDWLYIHQLNKDCHLWTIQDAGKGDVLYSPSLSLLWIFKSIDTVYCGCNLNYNDGAFCGEGYIVRPTDAIPATEEQRDTLFAKMKEAGYEWDAEEIELKKIEQKPADKIEPKFKVGDVVCDKSCTTLNKGAQPNYEIVGIKNGRYICEEGVIPIEHQDQFELVAKKIEPKFHEKDWSADDYLWQITGKEQCDLLYTKIKEAGYEWDDEKKEFKQIKNPAWSEKDEAVVKDICDKLSWLRVIYTGNQNIACQKDMYWLKSLKQRIGG